MGVSLGVGGSSSNTSGYSITAPPKYISNAYKAIIPQAQAVAATPYTPYPGQLTAGLTDAQNTAIAGLGNAQQAYQPYYDQAAQYGQQSTTAVTPMEFNAQNLAQYQNPYIQDVVNSTLGDLTRLFGQQQTQVTGNAISSGAWGGDRAGIVKSNLANNQANTAASTLAKLYSDSFNNATTQFNTANNAQMTAQQQNNANALAAAGLYQGLGTGASTNAINLNQALMGAGTTQQATNQAGLDAQYQQFLNQQQYPFETLSWLTGIATGVGSNAGGTTIGNSSTSGSSFGAGVTSKADGGRVLDMEPDGAGIYTLSDVLRGFAAGGDVMPDAGGGYTLGTAPQAFASGGDVMPYASQAHGRPAGLSLPIQAPARGSGPPRGGIPDPGRAPPVPSVGASGGAPDLQQGLDRIKDSIAPPPEAASESAAPSAVAPAQAGAAPSYSPPRLLTLGSVPTSDAGTVNNALGLTGIALGWMLATGSLGSVVRNPNRSAVSTPVFILRTQVHPAVQIPAKKARGRSSENANHTSPPAALLNSLKLVNGTTQRFSGPSQRCQCLLAVLRMLVVPLSGSRRNSSLKSTAAPWPRALPRASWRLP